MKAPVSNAVVCYRVGLSEATKVAEGRYLKEVIYEGEFKKENDPFNNGNDIEFTVTGDLIDYWVSTAAKQRHKGIEHPVVSTHLEDGKRGKIVDMYKDTNDDGKNALFMVLDIEGELEPDDDVSIFAEPNWHGEDYPIRHLSITKDPVIKRLGKFNVIACSLKEPDMTMKDLAKALGVSFEDGMDDAAIGGAIKSFVSKLKSKPDEKPKIAASFDGIHGITNDMDDAAVVDIVRGLKAPEKPRIAASASTVRLTGENRQMKVQKLIDECRITPAVGKELIDSYCGESQIKIALSAEDNDGIRDADKFDAVITALSKNEPVLKTGENTPAQLDPKDNPLLVDDATEPVMF